MIVNTAYMYMGEKGPSVNPNIWEGGTVNYPYQVYGYSSFEPDNSRFKEWWATDLHTIDRCTVHSS